MHFYANVHIQKGRLQQRVADMFYSWILPIGVQGAKDNTVVCVYAWEACTSKMIEQDKVNYAVSEREDRVTDFTTLTRMAGYTGMYWAATVLCRAVLGCTGM